MMSTPIISSLGELERVERGSRVDERDAAAGDDALFDGRAGRLQRVLDAVLLLLELDLGGRADLDDGHAAGELGQTLLELLRSKSESEFSISALIWLMRALMSSSAPAPSMMVVLSLVILTVFGAAEHARASTFSSLMPSSSETTWPPVTMAMSSSMRLRRSPKPGALTATEVNVPRSLLTTSVGERLALDVLGDDEQLLAGLHDLLEHRQQVLDVADLLVGDEDVADRRARPPCGRGR